MPSKQEEIREGIKEILGEDLINLSCTHENPPPGKDCSEECNVALEDQIAASNPFCSPCRSGGKKHKKCMDCWNEYIDGLVLRLITKQDSQGVVIKVGEPIDIGYYPTHSYVYDVEPLIEENNNNA